ncbi:MAG: 50S ribosomal protein L29 [Alphaproteobacteria bacterium]|jgi:large subunit ribosomal protein L29|nr:50S ribosomal protein L29 [Alphaproteobacteria bacterium]MCV6599531.1 50S ribosomal protein L29 [Alphaproteobacteria bacterium]
MKITDIRAKSIDELKAEIVSLKKELFNLRFQKASGQLENTARMSEVKKTVAKIKTVLSEKKGEK